jgi:hypothetical protein
MRALTCIVLACLLTLVAVTQAQEWVRVYLPDWARSGHLIFAAPCGRDGIVLAGSMAGDTTHNDFMTARFTMQGEAVWEQRYDNTGSDDRVRGMAVAPDGRVVVCGQSWQDDVGGGGSYDWAIVSYRPDGETAWSTRFSPAFDGDDYPEDIAVDAAGNVVVTGCAEFKDTTIVWPSFATLLIDTAGVVRWVAQSESSWAAKCVALDSSGCVYVGGLGGPYVPFFLYVKYGPDGRERWRVQLADPYPLEAEFGRDGAVYFAGVKPDGTRSDYWVAKFDTAGRVLWERTYDGPGHGEDRVYDLALDEESNIYVTGYSKGSGTGNDICTVSWDSAGTERWVARHGTPNSDLGYGLCLDSGFVYVVGELKPVGSDHSDACLLKYDAADGTLQWAQTYDGPAGLEDYYAGVCVGQDGRVYVVGSSMRSLGGSWDALLACYLVDGTSIEDATTVHSRPASSGQLVRRSLVLRGGAAAWLVDAFGRRVQDLTPGMNNVTEVSAGVYFVQSRSAPGGERSVVHRVVIAK